VSNYAMLKRLQERFAGKPVKFLLTPCNQFKNQEPGTNAEIKAFAEQSVALGPDSNVIMLAKSNLNGVPCAATGEGTCTPSSAECCPKNDAVYDYLLSATSPGTIKWNFDKIITWVDGKPYAGETVYHGGDLDDKMDEILDGLLSAKEAELSASDDITQYLSAFPGASTAVHFTALAKPMCAAAFFAAWGLISLRRRGSPRGPALLEEGSASDAHLAS